MMPSLLDLPGVGPIVAGVLLAETGDPRRFANSHQFASYCGVAPVEQGSGQNRRMQVNPGESPTQLGSPYCGDGPVADGWWPVEEVPVQVAETRQDQALGALAVKTYIARELFRALRQAYSPTTASVSA